MEKQEAIQKAYGEYSDIALELCDKNGWIKAFDYHTYFPQDTKKKRIDGYFCMRPKSLQGIENNNGWTKIESEEDLPTLGYYEVIRRDTGKPERSTLDNDFGSKIAIEMYTHWKPIEILKMPIY